MEIIRLLLQDNIVPRNALPLAGHAVSGMPAHLLAHRLEHVLGRQTAKVAFLLRLLPSRAHTHLLCAHIMIRGRVTIGASAHLLAYRIERATLIQVVREAFWVQLQIGLALILRLYNPVLLLIGHAEIGELVLLMVRSPERATRPQAAKAALRLRQLRNPAHILRLVLPIHGLVAIGTLVRFPEYKIEVAIKPLIARVLKLRRQAPDNIANPQIDQHNRLRQAVLMKLPIKMS